MIGRALVAAFVCAVASASAHAQSAPSFTVGATIVAGCSVQTIAGGDWGRVNLGTMPGLSTATVEADLIGSGTGLAIECTPGSTATVRADMGKHVTGGVRALAPVSGTARVPYRLILDGGAEWTSQAVSLEFTVAQPVRRLPLRGRAMLPGTLPAGRYTDVVTVTVTL